MVNVVDRQLIRSKIEVDPAEFQWEGVDFLYKAKRAILADETGVGKTGQAYMTWTAAGRPGPALIIARSNAQSTWQIQSKQWGCQMPYSISGTPKQRAKEWSDVDQYSLVTTTLNVLLQDYPKNLVPKRWGFVIFDEYHRYIINRKTTAYKFAKKLLHPSVCERVLLLTGSPMRKGFWDLWAPLNILDHRTFSTYWGFLQTFGHIQVNEWGAWEVLALKEKDALTRRITPYYLRREKKDVLPQLPPSRRILDHRLVMQPKQQKMYDDIADELMTELTDGTYLMTPNHLTKITRLRQILCTPRILDPNFVEWGAGLEHLGEMIEETDNLHFVIFTPFTDAIPYIGQYLSEHKITAKQIVVSLQGGLKPIEVTERIEIFKQTKGICICSIQYSESFDLVPANWAYFLGFSWDVWTDNLQAEARLHRFTTKEHVSYYYPLHEGGVDLELMMPILNEKTEQALELHNNIRRLRQLLQQSRERKGPI